MTPELKERLRELPSVDELASSFTAYPRTLVVSEARRVLASLREKIRQGHPAEARKELEGSLQSLRGNSLRPVINATGVVLHTNLGRAPLAAFEPPDGYTNLEYDLTTGKRGKRDIHVSGLLERLLDRPGIVVNNNAAAVFLALNELASGGEAIVSRGELIEIGDGFRIPDIMSRSGAIIREVGTTNRTKIEDYREVINERTRLILRVHPSNFQISGFTEKPSLSELAALAREQGIPLYEDLGSGCVVDLKPYGFNEPRVSDSIEAGVNLVSFSGDKLLGGPQAGIIAGDPALVTRVRRNPLFRALRVDKLIYRALETTLRLLLFERFSEIPTLRMLSETPDSIRTRAERLIAGLNATIIEGESVAGGGSTPDQTLRTWLIVLEGDATSLERQLRQSNPPVIARIENDHVVLDLRTVSPEEEPVLASALQICGSGAGPRPATTA